MKAIARNILGLLFFPATLWSEEDDVRKYLKESYTIVFSEAGTLKDVFDAGVRPYRFPGLESSQLEFTNCYVSFESAGIPETSPVPAQWVSLHMLKGGLLSAMEARSVPLDLEEAKQLMEAFLDRGERTSNELDEFLKAVREAPRDYHFYPNKYHGGFGFGWEAQSGPKYHVSFKPAFSVSRPLCLTLSVNWSGYRPYRTLRDFSLGPIDPPVGYAKVSMDAPEIFGPGTYLYETNSGREPGQKPETSLSTTLPPQERGPDWRWVLAGAGVAVFVATGYLISRQGRNSVR